MLYTGIHFKFNDKKRLKAKESEKINHANSEQRRMGVAVLI